VVIVVLLENAGEGSQVAAPVFAELAKVALGSLGQPVEELLPELLPTARPPEEPSIETPTPTPAPTLGRNASRKPHPGRANATTD
jgi:hypothetical protein